jgi:hypothetical protein
MELALADPLPATSIANANTKALFIVLRSFHARELQVRFQVGKWIIHS